MLYRLEFDECRYGGSLELFVEAGPWKATETGCRLPAGLVPFAQSKGVGRGAARVAIAQHTPAQVGARGLSRGASSFALGEWECR
jgi:hypothetical protein